MSTNAKPKVIVITARLEQAAAWAAARGLKPAEWEWPPPWCIMPRHWGIPLTLLPSMWSRPDAEAVADYVESQLRKRGREGLARFPVGA